MREKSRVVPRNLYGLVKAFLKDFYTESKRGTLRHKKGILIISTTPKDIEWAIDADRQFPRTCLSFRSGVW